MSGSYSLCSTVLVMFSEYLLQKYSLFFDDFLKHTCTQNPAYMYMVRMGNSMKMAYAGWCIHFENRGQMDTYT